MQVGIRHGDVPRIEFGADCHNAAEIAENPAGAASEKSI
jgi:hypothetical protein